MKQNEDSYRFLRNDAALFRPFLFCEYTKRLFIERFAAHNVDELSQKERELVRGVQLRTGYRVYLCLLKAHAASAKDIQKAMKFPTTAQAKYHLNRLVDLGLATEEENAIYTATGRRFGIMRFFLRIRHFVFPMSLFYGTFFAALTLILLLRSPSIEILLLGTLITAKEAADTYTFYGML